MAGATGDGPGLAVAAGVEPGLVGAAAGAAAWLACASVKAKKPQQAPSVTVDRWRRFMGALALVGWTVRGGGATGRSAASAGKGILTRHWGVFPPLTTPIRRHQFQRDG